MLLVDDGERQILEGDILREQRVGADDDADIARDETQQNVLARAALFPTGQQGDLDPRWLRQLDQRRVMLAGQDFRRRHQRRLATGLYHVEHRYQRHHGLAAADIALQKAQHAVGRRHVAGDLGNRLALRVGQRKG